MKKIKLPEIKKKEKATKEPKKVIKKDFLKKGFLKKDSRKEAAPERDFVVELPSEEELLAAAANTDAFEEAPVEVPVEAPVTDTKKKGLKKVDFKKISFKKVSFKKLSAKNGFLKKFSKKTADGEVTPKEKKPFNIKSLIETLRNSGGISRKIQFAIVPFIFIAFIALMLIILSTTNKTLRDSMERTLEKESHATAYKVVYDMMTVTQLPSIEYAYKTILTRDTYLKEVCYSVENMTVMDYGFAFIVDKETGNVIAHNDLAVKRMNLYNTADKLYAPIGKALKNVSLEKASEIIKIKTGSNTYYTILEPISTETPWIVVCCLPEAYVTDDLRPMAIQMISIILIITVLTIGWIAFFVSRMTAPIKGLTNVLSAVADGDFTAELPEKGNDEIAVMSRGMNEFLAIMREVISDITDISNQLNSLSGSSKDVAGTLTDASETQAESMGDMQVTLDQIANAIQELASHATTLATVVDNTNQSGSVANEKMNQTVQIAEKGRNDMEEVAKKMDEIVESMNELNLAVTEVGTSTQEINSIVKLIGDIASQTNLLSLNAAIEAARAGEAGRGFSVVADEIGKLAEMSSTSAKQISKIIAGVTKQVDTMVLRTTESVGYIQENSAQITTSYEIFETIYQDISTTGHMLSDIVDQLQQVDDVATNIAALAEEQSASTEEILASTLMLSENSLQIAEDSKQVAQSAESVSDAAFTLGEHMRRFKA